MTLNLTLEVEKDTTDNTFFYKVLTCQNRKEELTQSSHTVFLPSPSSAGRALSGLLGYLAWSASPASVAGGDCFRAAGHHCGEG